MQCSECGSSQVIARDSHRDLCPTCSLKVSRDLREACRSGAQAVERIFGVRPTLEQMAICITEVAYRSHGKAQTG